MYVPDYFKLTDEEVILEIMRKYDFVTLLTQVDEQLLITKLPVLVEKDSNRTTIKGHLAPHNPQAHSIFGRSSTVLFQGPHHYISPRWYLNRETVPTWDYITVAATGKAERLSKVELMSLLKSLSTIYDPEWSALGLENESYYQAMSNDIVGFYLVVDTLTAKAKLNQNHPQENIVSVIHNLEGSDQEGKDLAQYMKRLAIKTK